MSNSKLCMPIDVHFLSASFYVYKVENFVKKHKPANEFDPLGSVSGEIFGHESSVKLLAYLSFQVQLID
jgi:hypothetical protein